MPMTSSFLLMVALAFGPPPDLERPAPPAGSGAPASCIATTDIAPPGRHRHWHRLLPTVVFGLDYQPRQDGRFDFHGHMPGAKSTGLNADRTRHQVDDRQRIRWTVALRWRSRSSNRPALPPTTTPLSPGICAQWHTLRSHRPTGLVEAVDHWVESGRLRALLAHAAHREVTHD